MQARGFLKPSFEILLAESYLLFMKIERTWTWNQAQNWGA